MTTDMQQPAPAPERSLRRRTDHAMVAGVAAGLAEHFKLSTGAIRIAFIALCFMGGTGFVLYVLGWLLIPEAGARRSIAERVFDDTDDSNPWLPIVLVGLAAVVVLASLDVIDNGFILASALFGIGFLVYRTQGRIGDWTLGGGDATDASPVAEERDPSTATQSYLDAARAEIDEIGGPPLGDLDPPLTFVDPPTPTPVRVPRPRSYLGRLTLASALILVGVMATLDASGIFDASLADYLAAIVGVIGIGLLVGSVAGRARWLIIAGVVLVPVLLAASLIKVPLASSFGEFSIEPTTMEQLDHSYEFGGADVRFDLRELPPPTENRIVSIELGGGQLEVIVPSDYPIVLDAEVAAGEIDVDVAAETSLPVAADDMAGVLLDQRIDLANGEEPALELLIEAAFGSVKLVIVEGR